MANYVYKIEQNDKTIFHTAEYYFTSLKKVTKSYFAPLFKHTKSTKNCVVMNRIKECRGVTGIIFEIDSNNEHVILRKIKPL